MLNSNQAFVVKLEPQGQKEIERFTDIVCDSLYINETYYGCILMALTSVFELCLENHTEEALNMMYTTDYQTVTIDIEPIEGQIIDTITSQIDLDAEIDEHHFSKIMPIQSLTDEVKGESNSLSITFNIGAMHNSVYEERMKHLNNYLTRMTTPAAKTKDDKLQ